MFRQGIGSIVVAHQHHLVDQVTHHVAIVQLHPRVLGHKHVWRNLDGIVHITVLHSQ